MNDFSSLNSARSVAEAADNYPNSPEGKAVKSIGEIAKNTQELRELQELRRITDALQQQVELAMNEAAATKKAAFFSKCCSILSLLIGIAGLGVAIISLVTK